MTLAAVFASLFMILGATHAVAHGDEPHADCIAGHVTFASAAKVAPPDGATIASPQFLTFRLAAPQPLSAPKGTRSLPARSRSPPLQ